MKPQIPEAEFAAAGDPMEMLLVFIRHSTSVGAWFRQLSHTEENHRLISSNLKAMITFEEWYRKERIEQMAKKVKELPAMPPDTVDEPGVMTIIELIRGWEQSRKKTLNKLGQLDDDVWKWRAKVPEGGMKSAYQLITDLAQTDIGRVNQIQPD